jgi:hypothetical protein
VLPGSSVLPFVNLIPIRCSQDKSICIARLSSACRSADRSDDSRPVTWQSAAVCDGLEQMHDELLGEQQVP